MHQQHGSFFFFVQGSTSWRSGKMHASSVIELLDVILHMCAWSWRRGFFSFVILLRVFRADGRLVNMSGVFCTNNAQAPSLFSNVTLTSRLDPKVVSYTIWLKKGTVARNCFNIPSTSCVCLLVLRWKRGRELVHCLYKKLQTVLLLVKKKKKKGGGGSFFQTRKPVRAIEFYVLSDVPITCVLYNFYIDFSIGENGTFKQLRANEVYVHARAVLTTVDLWGYCKTSGSKAVTIFYEIVNYRQLAMIKIKKKKKENGKKNTGQ